MAATSQQSAINPWRAVAWRLLLPGLLVLTTCCYWSILDSFFVQDDYFLLTAVERPWPNSFLWRGVCFFRPLSTYWLTLANVSLWGLEPFWHHAMHFALFLATLGFLANWLRSLTGSLAAALAGTTLYAFSKTHLYTLAWIAGGIDVSAAFFFVVALWATNRYLRLGGVRATQADGAVGRRRRLLWTIGLSFCCGLLCKESCIAILPACVVWVLARKIAERRSFVRADAALLVVLLAIVVVYVPAWWAADAINPNSASGLQFDWGRGLTVLRDSLWTVIPVAEADLRQQGLWLPTLVFAALATMVAAMARSSRSDAATLAMAAALWIAPAGIFVVTEYPWELQLYYSHFSVFGLAVVVALAVARCAAWRFWSERSLRIRHGVAWVAAALVIVWLGTAGRTIRAGIEHKASPALGEAAIAKTVYEQLNAELRLRPYRKIVFLNTSRGVWASMQYGEMLRVLFPDLRVDCVGRDGYQAPEGLRTSGTTLVVRSEKQCVTVVR